MYPSVMWCVFILAALVACAPPASDSGQMRPQTELALEAQDIALNNRGVALMGYFDYANAAKTFEQVVARQPDWHAAKLNLAVAALNLQTEEDERRALALASEVLHADPANPRGHYISGLLKLYRSRVDEAAEHFRAVLAADPDDAYAAYYLGQCVEPTDGAAALALYERAQRADPYLRSAYYSAALLLRRLGRLDDAKTNLDVYTRLADNPRARLAEFKYTRMGDKGNAQVADLPGTTPQVAPDGPVFLPPTVVAAVDGTLAGLTLSTADLHGNGIADVFIASAQGRASQLLAGAEDELQRRDEHPLTGVSNVRAVAWGDIDNDGLVDAYLCRDGANALWRQTARDTWQDVTRSSATANGRARCADVAMLDADHDGDLDILIANADGAGQLLSNNLDGTFRALGGKDGLDLDTRGARQVLANDFDNDRDVDLLFINQQPPHQMFMNDRLWAYHAAPGNEALLNAPIRAAVSVDTDADGRVDIVTVDAQGAIQIWQQSGGGDFAPRTIGQAQVDDQLHIAAVEFDGFGQPELLVRDANAIRVLVLDDAGRTAFEAAGRFGATLPILGNASDGPGLLALRNDGDKVELVRFAPGPGRGGFVALTFSGKEQKADSMRSNRSGIGTRVALRTGSAWQLSDSLDKHSGPGQSLQPLVLAAGTATRADFVALTWSDGVFQTELDLAAGEVHALTETQRQLSSCPVVFAWDGERFAFVSDVLGVGGVGFLLAPGQYATPRPWEYFLLPEGALAPLDGQLALKITEPMEEIAYLDQARLHVYDLAAPWSMVMDERMGTGAPSVSGEALFYRREILPTRATDGAGKDIIDELRVADGVAVSPGHLDVRFIGRTAAPHTVTLEFDEPLTTAGARPVLIADGWVEYPYSQTVFAAWQAAAAYTPPTLEARVGNGRWQTVYAQFGYPAGMPRRMAVPLDALPAGTTALRLTSSLQLYWDRLAVAFAETPGDAVQRHEVPLQAAQVARTGFARRTNGPQYRPDYDYAQRAPLWDSRYLHGWYTAFGPATELVATRDDAFAIIGPGEEIDLRFAAPAAAPAGMRRHYVLEVRGYAKDMDMYTRDGGQVEPLPRTADILPAQRAAARAALHARFNTRYEAGH